jgi:hypothetical protein
LGFEIRTSPERRAGHSRILPQLGLPTSLMVFPNIVGVKRPASGRRVPQDSSAAGDPTGEGQVPLCGTDPRVWLEPRPVLGPLVVCPTYHDGHTAYGDQLAIRDAIGEGIPPGEAGYRAVGSR